MNLSVLFLALVLLIGGGSTHGQAADAVLAAASFLVIPFALLLHLAGVRPIARVPISLLVLFGGLLLVALLQLLPLGIGRTGDLGTLAADIRASVGLDASAHSLTYDERATLRFATLLTLPIAILLLVSGAARKERRLLLMLLVAAGLLSSAMALLQLAFGNAEWIVFFERYGIHKGGLFNNTNHQPTFLALAWCAAVVLYVKRRPRRESPRLPTRKGYRNPSRVSRHVLLALVLAGLLPGVALSGSRAGIALFALTVLLTLLVLRPDVPARAFGGRRKLAAVTASVAVVGATLAFGAVSIAAGAGSRLSRLPEIADLARAVQPWGVGFGSFADAYETVEPLDDVLPMYLNHTHNEPLHFLIEGGLPGLLVIAVFIAMAAVSLRRDWRAGSPASRRATLVILAGLLAVMLHGLVDYPLRTSSIAGSVAVLLTLLLSASPEPSPKPLMSDRLQFVGIVIASFFAISGGIAAFDLHRAEALYRDGRSQAALQHDADHPQALAAVAWSTLPDDPDEARSLAMQSLDRAPLTSAALRTLLVLDSPPNATDEEGWRRAARLGWRDTPVQAVLFAASSGDDPQALRHLAALARRRAIDERIAGYAKPLLADRTKADIFVDLIGSDPSLVLPLLRAGDTDDPRSQDGVANLLLALDAANDVPILPRFSAPVMGAMLASDRREAAVRLHRSLYPDREPLAVAPYVDANLGERTPFDFSAPDAGNFRTSLRGETRSLAIRGRGTATGTVTRRLLATAPGPITMTFELARQRGRPTLEVRLACPGSTEAAGTLQLERSGRYTFSPEKPLSCWAPMLEIAVTRAPTPFALQLNELALD